MSRLKPHHEARLLKLADILKKDARRRTGIKFDMTDWGRVSDPDDVLSCGTQGCAFGLAAMSGEFKRAGLGYRLTEPHDRGSLLPPIQNIVITWKGRDAEPFPTAVKLFGISRDEADELFTSASGCHTSQGAPAELYVAKRLKALVRAYKAKDPEAARERWMENP